MPRKRREDSPGQQHYDWDRQSQLKALNDLRLPKGLIGLDAPVSRGTAMLALRVIDDCQRENPYAWPSLPTIAARMQRCKKTARRALDALESIGLVTTWKERDDNGHQLMFTQINWEHVFGELLPTPVKETVSKRRKFKKPVDSFAEPVDSFAEPVDSFAEPVDSLDFLTTYEAQSEPPTEALPPTPRRKWEEVEKELISLGVTHWSYAAGKAAKHVDPQHAWELCQFFRSEYRAAGWNARTLYFRFLDARPFLPAQEGWPARQSSMASSPRSEYRAEPECQVMRQLDEMSPEEVMKLAAKNPTLMDRVKMFLPRDPRSHSELKTLLARQLSLASVLVESEIPH